jgi:RNA polymerase sigma factor (sigma-70 family)
MGPPGDRKKVSPEPMVFALARQACDYGVFVRRRVHSSALARRGARASSDRTTAFVQLAAAQPAVEDHSVEAPVIPDFERRLAQAKAGNSAASFALVQEFSPLLWERAKRYRDAKRERKVSYEDLAQKTLLNAGNKIATFFGGTANDFLKWLFKILKNLAIKAGLAFATKKRDVSREVPLESAANARSPDPTPLDVLLQLEHDERVKRAIDALDDVEKQILKLHSEGIPDVEAARLTRMTSVKALRSRRKRIQARIAAEVAGNAIPRRRRKPPTPPV